jgi:hypothetical protein
MKLYRKALPLEIVDGVAIWPLHYITPIEITEGEIRDMFSAISYTDLDGVVGLEEAIIELLSRLK